VPLLEAGVELFELGPRATPTRAAAANASGTGSGSASGGGSSGSGPGGKSRATLHAKALVIDASDVWIGSLNLDRRSLELNTEIVLAIRSTALAAQLRERFARATEPRNSYRVSLEPGTQDLRWKGAGEHGPIVVDDEPETTPAQRLRARATSLFPFERQL
jgi:putative cardiolipin synthase